MPRLEDLVATAQSAADAAAASATAASTAADYAADSIAGAVTDGVDQALADLDNRVATQIGTEATQSNTAVDTIVGAAIDAIEHGWLNGLEADDHPQYHTDTRGDARYYTKTLADDLFATKLYSDATFYTKAEAEAAEAAAFDAERVRVGTTMFWPTAFAPAGWWSVDGSVKKRADSPGLFAMFGTTQNTGGEAADEFRLPDWRGLSPVAVNAAISKMDTILKKGGAHEVTLTVSNLPDHVHKRSFANTGGAGTAGYLGAATAENWAIGGSGSQGIDAPAGTLGKAHENMPPFVALNWIIRYIERVDYPLAADIISHTHTYDTLPAKIARGWLAAGYTAATNSPGDINVAVTGAFTSTGTRKIRVVARAFGKCNAQAGTGHVFTVMRQVGGGAGVAVGDAFQMIYASGSFDGTVHFEVTDDPPAGQVNYYLRVQAIGINGNATSQQRLTVYDVGTSA